VSKKPNAFTAQVKIDPAWLKSQTDNHQKGLNARRASEVSPYGRKITAAYIDPRKKGEYL